MYKPLQILTVKAPTMIRASLTTTAVNLKKITKDNPMKKYNRENKLLFGALLETQAQRKKRLKEEGILMREAKENEPDDPPVSNIEAVEISKPLEIECDYSKMTLSEILKKDFPLENHTKPLITISNDTGNPLVSSDKPQDSVPNYYPSVTSILSATMSPLARQALERWRKNKIATLGVDGFLALNKGFGKSNVAIEWKKSDSKKSTIDKTYDAPLQLAAYMGAINYDNSYTSQVTSGVVVVVYEDGSPASVFPVVAEYWSHWYRRYQAFHKLENQENV
ncbi:uncharacterized protein LOC103515914 [Diaphorina citri]|uniref:Uncharacterized protein LOC103515914 n=1 Tax=Diaphorina citri TaxID=121845 RepID=A0A3Q0J722_DIACI|nr:uncharacterized protein LOC103515914 [Diaphorina citri]